MPSDAENSTATAAENDQPVGGGAQGSATSEAKFTQADLDRIAGDTRKSAKEKAIADFMKELGVEKPEDAKSLIAAAKAKADADKTEAQKATEALAAEQAKREAAEAKLTAYEAKQAIDARNNAIKAAAKDMPTPEDAVSWLRDNAPADLDALKADTNGKYDDKALKPLIDKVRAARPAWFKPTSPGSPSVSGGRAVAQKPKEIGSTFKL